MWADIFSRPTPLSGACLRSWASTKPTCPLCAAAIVSITCVATGACEPPPPPRPPSRAAEVTQLDLDALACIDHAALAAEATALLSRVESVRVAIVGRRRASSSSGVDAAALEDVAATARGVLALARSPDAFDPVLALRCLSDLDSELDAAASGGGGDPDRRASWGAAFASPPWARGRRHDTAASDDDDDLAFSEDERPPPHVLDLGAALEAAAARCGRGHGGRRRS